MAQPGSGYLARPAPSGLADVVELVLDKGLVLDAFVRVSLLGIELLTVDARIVVASVDTYLRFAEATNRLDLWEQGPPSLLDALEEGSATAIENVADHVVEDKVEDALDSVGDVLGEPAEKVARTVGRKILETAEDVVGDARTDE
jgi:gas vesicle structural protein